VLPPSVCILLELCKYGSLSDVLRKRKAGKSRRMNVTYLDLLWLAIGCCRGLCALHASGDDVCHRDIKSMNFLGKEQMIVAFLYAVLYLVVLLYHLFPCFCLLYIDY
jgi:serine/threonine protein kinase